MIFTREDSLVLQATDLELSLTVIIPAQVEVEGCTVVTGKHLTELVRRLPDEDLTLQIVEETQQLEINYSKAAAHVNTWSAGDFPALQPAPTQNEIIMPGTKWKKIMRKISFAAASQEIRPNYAGVYVQFEPELLKAVATDTYRLALFYLPYRSEAVGTALFIPVRPLHEVSRLLGDEQQLSIKWDQAVIAFQTESFVLTARLMDAQFPAYERVIPKGFKTRLRIDKEQLSDCLERALLFIENPGQQAVVDFKVEADVLCLSAQAVQVGSLKEEIPLLGLDGEEEKRLTFTSRYLLEPLRAMDSSEVVLCLNGPGKPAVYLEEGEEYYLHLVLPVQRATDQHTAEDGVGD
jgi:DNA polymerase-3 subunit beta